MSTGKPNILFIQTDQMAAPALPCYGHPVVQAENLNALAEGGVVFDSAYCNNPLCAPSRSSMMTGQLCSKIGTYDNAAEFCADIPTFGHYLRALGYQTSLCGKMHFVGPDQRHGFEDRLTTDIYPADYGWTPDWDNFQERIDWWYHNMSSVTEAQPCERTNQIDFDDEVEFQAMRKIYDLARSDDKRPFCLVVSFSNPHDPYACPEKYWDRYDHKDIDLPKVPPLPADRQDPHTRRLQYICGMDECPVSKQQIRKARHAYYGQISYIDDKVGRLLKALDDTALRDNTIIFFAADHGDMLGERGLWYKMCFFEWSARVPLIVNCPGKYKPCRIGESVSLVDLLPTFLDIAGFHQGEAAAPLDGTSLLPYLTGQSNRPANPVLSEYFAEGSIAPCFMIRQAGFKYIYCQPDPPQLFDLTQDPDELNNLSGQKAYHDVEENFSSRLHQIWQPERLDAQVRASQKRRRLIFKSHMTGKRTSWDFQPFRDASGQYMRNHLDLNVLERAARIVSRKK